MSTICPLQMLRDLFEVSRSASSGREWCVSPWPLVGGSTCKVLSMTCTGSEGAVAAIAPGVSSREEGAREGRNMAA
jgi:hypothetical protein